MGHLMFKFYPPIKGISWQLISRWGLVNYVKSYLWVVDEQGFWRESYWKNLVWINHWFFWCIMRVPWNAGWKGMKGWSVSEKALVLCIFLKLPDNTVVFQHFITIKSKEIFLNHQSKLCLLTQAFELKLAGTFHILYRRKRTTRSFSSSLFPTLSCSILHMYARSFISSCTTFSAKHQHPNFTPFHQSADIVLNFIPHFCIWWTHEFLVSVHSKWIILVPV